MSRWAIFCAVVDNYGDLGVCLRLARQLHAERGCHVTLWVDDISVAETFLGITWRDGVSLEYDGLHLRHWPQEWSPPTDAAVAAADVVIEAFGCNLPTTLIESMAERAAPPLWINLEYLSAELWVGDWHLLRSMISVKGDKSLLRTFFFPGFRSGTGGLLRERSLLSRQAGWQRENTGSRLSLLRELGSPLQPADDCLVISLFTYESRSLPGWLDALSRASLPACLLVPEGRILPALAVALGLRELSPGDVVVRGSLTVAVLPFMTQDQYDRLLGTSDFNLVRGEDSFVRAQWAARPLLWHIYRQQEEAHLAKLRAFLDIYSMQGGAAAPGEGSALADLASFWLAWNRGEDCGDLWHHLRPQLPSLQEHARKWQRELAKSPDLVTNLLRLQHDWQHEQRSQTRGQ